VGKAVTFCPSRGIHQYAAPNRARRPESKGYIPCATLSALAVALVTLALGIGANTAVFSFVNGVLLKPLPYRDPHSIVLVWEKPPGGYRNGISTLNFLDWKSQNTVFGPMAAVRFGGSATLTGAGEPVELAASSVSAPYFDIFGVRAALGRTFAADED
jgi:putative ABC transport system permease protein